MAKNKQMVHIELDNTLISRIDDFRFANRFAARVEAIRWLLDWALKQNPDAVQR